MQRGRADLVQILTLEALPSPLNPTSDRIVVVYSMAPGIASVTLSVAEVERLDLVTALWDGLWVAEPGASHTSSHLH